jgi:endonuclease/exonuclease/phosphatase family metal-dependent hydrolase
MTESALRGASRWGWWRAAVNHDHPEAPRLVREPGPPPADARPLLVASYNIELARRLDGVLRVLGDEPRLGGADILALQEADEEATERVADRFGFGFVYYASARHPTTGRNFGPALLSRWPIVEHAKLLLPGRGRTRGLLRVAVRATLLVRGERLRCYNLHLSTMWEMTPWSQDAQARAVALDAAGAGEAVLVVGDLNRRGAARVFTSHGFDWITRGVGRTHLAWSFDHVFARGLAIRERRASAVPAALAASDHKAVWAELALAPTAAAPAPPPDR